MRTVVYRKENVQFLDQKAGLRDAKGLTKLIIHIFFMKMGRNRAGLALGFLFGLMHLLWVLAVWAGMGQALANMAHSVHFLADMHEVVSAGVGTALFGIVGAFLSGYVTGWVFALLWGLFDKR